MGELAFEFDEDGGISNSGKEKITDAWAGPDIHGPELIKSYIERFTIWLSSTKVKKYKMSQQD